MPDSIIPKNRLKQLLRQNETALGIMLVEIRQPSIMHVLANAGFQFVLIDAEHGPFNVETIAELSRAGVQCGITPIVRVTEATYTQVTQALDAGAQGIMVPRITEPDQVREIVQIMKYPPVGRRGSVIARGHTEFKSGSVQGAMKEMNEETMLVVQVETKQAAERVEEIVAVPGVDAALIGPNDLSIALGVPGKMNDPVMVKAIERTFEACRKHGVVPAIHMNDIELGRVWAEKGMKMISLNSELGHLMKAGGEAVKLVRAASEQSGKTKAG